MNQGYPDPVEAVVNGFSVMIDDHLGHLCVAHDGSITWDQLQNVKNAVWGADVRAIEVYPEAAKTINNANMRHLWRLGKDDFCPDLLGRVNPAQTLERRFERAWGGTENDL